MEQGLQVPKGSFSDLGIWRATSSRLSDGVSGGRSNNLLGASVRALGYPWKRFFLRCFFFLSSSARRRLWRRKKYIDILRPKPATTPMFKQKFDCGIAKSANAMSKLKRKLLGHAWYLPRFKRDLERFNLFHLKFSSNKIIVS